MGLGACRIGSDMNGITVLGVLTLLSLIPLTVAYFWLRSLKKGMTSLFFIASIGAGLLSLALAALLQALFPPFQGNTLPALGIRIFGNVAAVEEISRFVILWAFFSLIGRKTAPSPFLISALGLSAGLAFSAIETATYGSTNLPLTILRGLTAAPLHGACGERIARGTAQLKKKPKMGLFLLVNAIAIHGMYDFLLIVPSSPAILPVALALVALAVSVVIIRNAPAPM